MASMETNSNHFVPRFLLKGWATTPDLAKVWTLDVLKDTLAEVRLEELCERQDERMVNDSWNTDVEHPAVKAISSLREIGSPAALPRILSEKEVKGWRPKTTTAVFDLFWSMRSRHPDTPSHWKALPQGEYLTEIRTRAGAAHPLERKYRLFALVLALSEEPMVLTDYTCFPLQPIGGNGVACLPLSPQVALLMVNREIAQGDLASMLEALPIGEVSAGGPAGRVFLPPGNQNNEVALEDVVRRHKAAALKWRPKIMGEWALGVRLKPHSGPT